MTLIAPFKTGLDTDQEPWLAPPDSFRELDNIHIKHGYLQKRQGYRPFGTLIDTVISISAITQAAIGVVTTTAAHGFATNDVVYFSDVVGAVTVIVNEVLFISVMPKTSVK